MTTTRTSKSPIDHDSILIIGDNTAGRSVEEAKL